MALSPPKASSAGLRARQAAKRDTAASAPIQAMVMVWTRRMRRMASVVAVCGTEAIRSIIIASWRLIRCLQTRWVVQGSDTPESYAL